MVKAVKGITRAQVESPTGETIGSSMKTKALMANSNKTVKRPQYLVRETITKTILNSSLQSMQVKYPTAIPIPNLQTIIDLLTSQ